MPSNAVPDIRRATPADAAELHELAAETFPLACPDGTSAGAIAEFIATTLSEAKFAEYLADPDRELFIAGAFVGYAMLVVGEPTDRDVAGALTARPTAELSKLYVREAGHGSGAAAALVDAVVVRARERDLAAVWLGVNQGNLRANRFYEKAGFAVVGRKQFRVGDELHDDFTRERVLAAGPAGSGTGAVR